MADLVRVIEERTPPGRDRGIDALRALAILGVVLGHWLVTAWERDPALAISSPLAYLPQLAPLSWVLQTLAVFFFVGGYVAARGLRKPYVSWVSGRMRRLLRPVVPVLGFWAVLTGVFALAGLPYREIRALVLPALGPLWFLTVFAALTALTPLLVRVRLAPTIVGMTVVVAVIDGARFALGVPAWIGWVNVLAAWLVPYLLGVLWAKGRLRGGAWLLVGGALGTAALVGWFGYPASMVGVTGARVSNLSPPTLAALCFGLAQVGLALLVHGPLSRLMRRPRVWAGVALANLSAMTIFLWHQTVLVLAVLTFSLYGRPDSAAWIFQRVGWVLLLAGTLAFMTWCRHQLDGRSLRL